MKKKRRKKDRQTNLINSLSWLDPLTPMKFKKNYVNVHKKLQKRNKQSKIIKKQNIVFYISATIVCDISTLASNT